MLFADLGLLTLLLLATLLVSGLLILWHAGAALIGLNFLTHCLTSELRMAIRRTQCMQRPVEDVGSSDHTTMTRLKSACRSSDEPVKCPPGFLAMTAAQRQPNGYGHVPPNTRMRRYTHCNKPGKSVTQRRARLVGMPVHTLWTPGGSMRAARREFKPWSVIIING